MLIDTTAVENDKLFPILSANKLAYLLKSDKLKIVKVANSAGRYYRPFDRQQIKKNGKIKWRHIDNPTGDLKLIQQRINRSLLKDIGGILPPGMMGGIKGKSIVKNASLHKGQEVIVTLDIKNCFPKTNNKQIFSVWRNLFGCGEEVSSLLTKLTTFQTRLPQGAPTSLALCNLALLPLYKDIEKLCLTAKVNFTLYIDDITISGNGTKCREIVNPIISIIQRRGYSVRRSKVSVMSSGMRQQVTGIVVNNGVSVASDYRENLREKIYSMSRKAAVSTKDFYALWGKIQHVKSVSFEQGEKLEDFALMSLPTTPDYFEPKEKEITRKCKCTKKHKYQ